MIYTLLILVNYRYNFTTGEGALGVEFAGTAVTSGSSFGSNISPEAADVKSTQYVSAKSNEDLQWSEGSYRGFFTLTIDPNTMIGTYYAMRNVSKYRRHFSSRHSTFDSGALNVGSDHVCAIGFANLDGFASANFTVRAGMST